jgi:hypothetical protein
MQYNCVYYCVYYCDGMKEALFDLKDLKLQHRYDGFYRYFSIKEVGLICMCIYVCGMKEALYDLKDLKLQHRYVTYRRR